MPSVGVFAAIFDERRRILLVKRSYGPKNWTTPGGRLDPNESPLAALEREVEEETGFRVRVVDLIGVYSAPLRDDLVLFFETEVVGQGTWEANHEISEIGFFPRDALPALRERTLARVLDAFEGKKGNFRVFRVDDID